jgi:hypothetical protein
MQNQPRGQARPTALEVPSCTSKATVQPTGADPAAPKRARQLNLHKFVELFEDEKHYINAKYYYCMEEGG